MVIAGLTRAHIVSTAQELVAERGLGNLTMRALADRLSVTPMSIYRHVENRDALVVLVADEIGGLVRPGVDPDAAWHHNARAWAIAERDVLRRFPGLAAWLMANGPAGEQAYRTFDLLAEQVLRGGFDHEEAARICAGIMSWVFSRVGIEDAQRERRKSTGVARAHQFLAGLATLGTGDHPSAVLLGPRFFSMDMDTLFTSGLDALLAGYAASEMPRDDRRLSS
jgi:AcrR family transcriptional regulator